MFLYVSQIDSAMHIHNDLYLILHVGLGRRILSGRCKVGKIQFKFFS